MERRYGRDLGLSVRMAVALAALGLFYLPFLVWLGLFAYLGTDSKPFAALLALVLAGLIPFTSAASERFALRSVHARELEPGDDAALRRRVERLCALGDLPVPRLAVAETELPNAFSAGRTQRNAVLVVTRGLLERLDERELEAVLAHELAHIANRDAVVMTFVAGPALLARKLVFGLVELPTRSGDPGRKLGGAILFLYVIPFLLVGWIACAFATLLVMTISRYREFAADRGAALLTGAPEALMSALQKLASEAPLIPSRDLRSVNAFLFVSADAPVGWLDVDPLRLFPTHPPVERRLERLAELSRTLARPARLGVEPAEIERPPRAENPQAVASFSLALLVYSALGVTAIFAQWDMSDLPLWLPFGASLALLAGIVCGFQGLGRASAGAKGMGYAVTGLALLLGPWALAFVALMGGLAYALVTA